MRKLNRHTFPSLNAFEARLTSSDLAKVRRYLTQCIPCLQYEEALWNLSTNIYKGKPLSKSILIHELTETEEFEKIGFDFSNKTLETAQQEVQEAKRREKQKVYRINSMPHLSATRTQFEYLSRFAESQGRQFSPGILLRLSPFHSKDEVSRVCEAYPYMSVNPMESHKAGRFMVSLLREEPQYASWILDGLDKGRPKSGIYLYDFFGEEIRAFAK
jgi:hypothetical protein